MTAVPYLAIVAFLASAAAGIYYLGDRPSRHPALTISAISLGVMCALQAVVSYYDSPRWIAWLYAIAAVSMPIVVIWSSRREERRRRAGRAGH